MTLADATGSDASAKAARRRADNPLTKPESVPRSGPVFYRRLRASLLGIVIAATLSAIFTFAVYPSLAHGSLDDAERLEQLGELTVQLANSQQDALVWLANRSQSTASETSAWQHYQTGSDALTASLITTANLTDPADSMLPVAIAIDHWRQGIWQAHASLTAGDMAGAQAELIQLTAGYSAISEALADASATDIDQVQASLVILSISLAGLSVLAIFVGLCLTARRSHRLINRGLALALITGLASFGLLVQFQSTHPFGPGSSGGIGQSIYLKQQLREIGQAAATAAMDQPGGAVADQLTKLALSVGETYQSAVAPAWSQLEDFINQLAGQSPAEQAVSLAQTTAWSDLESAIELQSGSSQPAVIFGANHVLVITSLVLLADGLTIASVVVGIRQRSKEYR
ncbi:MAG: hypothetical protein LBV30_09000 [Propionibacteriaceae bacterium]|jgi:hypothetical protein|nr:hypothetical protein [Propionibacteriaceae bacterium]